MTKLTRLENESTIFLMSHILNKTLVFTNDNLNMKYHYFITPLGIWYPERTRSLSVIRAFALAAGISLIKLDET